MEKRTKRDRTEQRQMAPFTRDDLQLIRRQLLTDGCARDIALLEVGIDSMLRIGDLLKLRVRHVRDLSDPSCVVILESFSVVQEKTGVPVQVNLTAKARAALKRLIEDEGKWSDDYLFTRAGMPHCDPLDETMVRRIVKQWAVMARRDPRQYSGHSLRRTKAAFIYGETKDLAAVKELLGHTSLQHTSKYLGVDRAKAASVALKYDL